jgi:hypothetical protein
MASSYLLTMTYESSASGSTIGVVVDIDDAGIRRRRLRDLMGILSTLGFIWPRSSPAKIPPIRRPEPVVSARRKGQSSDLDNALAGGQP